LSTSSKGGGPRHDREMALRQANKRQYPRHTACRRVVSASLLRQSWRHLLSWLIDRRRAFPASPQCHNA